MLVTDASTFFSHFSLLITDLKSWQWVQTKNFRNMFKISTNNIIDMRAKYVTIFVCVFFFFVLIKKILRYIFFGCFREWWVHRRDVWEESF